MASYIKRAVKGAGIVFLFAVIATILGYLLRIVLARNLTPAEYGLFYAGFSMIAFFAIFGDLGTVEALKKFIPDFKVKKKLDKIKSALIYSFSIQFIVSTIGAIIIILLSDFLAVNLFHYPQASLFIKLLGVMLWLRQTTSYLAVVFNAFQNMVYYASIDLMRTALILIIAWLGFQFVKNIYVPTFAYLLTPIILALILLPLLFKKVFPQFFDYKLKLDKKLTKDLLKFGAPLMLFSVGGLILGYTDTIMLTYFRTLEEVGLYNVALPTINLLGFFGIALGAVIFPMTSELWAKNQKEKLIQGFSLLYKYSFILILPLSLILFSFPKIIITFLFGGEYVGASSALRILSIGIILLTINKVNFNAIAGIGRPKINSKIVLIAAVFNLFFNFMLIPILGIIGAAITTLIGYIIMTILSLGSLIKLIKIAVPIKGWIKNLFAALIFIVVIYYLKSYLALNVYIEAIVVVLVSSAIYIGLLFLLRIIDLEEVKFIIGQIK